MSDVETNYSSFLSSFAEGTSVRDLVTAATGLIKVKKVHAVRDTDLFASGLARLREFGLQKGDARTRVEAVAALQRLRAVLKKKSGQADKALVDCLETELPSAQLLEDADGRFYLASALPLAKGEWVANYAARELLRETASDIAAAALAKSLLHRAGTIDAALRILLEQRRATASQEQLDGNDAARRLRRVFTALRNALRSERCDSGVGLAKDLRRLLLAFLEQTQAASDQKPVKEGLDALAHFVDDLIRNRLSLVVDSELYLVFAPYRRWAGSLVWNAVAGKIAGVKVLVQTLLEGIRISARQGITDQGLFDALELLTGSRDNALQKTRRAADETEGLSEAAQSWLRTGKVPQAGASSVLADQSALLQSDQYVALALLDALDAEVSESSLPPKLRALVVSIRNLADSRNLAVFGTAGEVVPYSPSRHDVVSGAPDAGKVSIIRPGVERTDASGNRHVVTKAFVKAVRENET